MHATFEHISIVDDMLIVWEKADVLLFDHEGVTAVHPFIILCFVHNVIQTGTILSLKKFQVEILI